MVSFRMSLTDLNCVSRKLKLEGCDRERVAVVKYRMDNGGCNGAGCFEVKIWADTAKFTNVIVARFRTFSDLVRECIVFVENKTKVASGVGCAVLYFRECV